MTHDELQSNIKVRDDGCWIWTGARVRGYGIVMREKHPGFGRTCVPAHRDVYELLVRPLEPHELLDHLCRSRACVNPDHVDPVTQKENLRRSARTQASRNAAKTHCPAGHEYAGTNLIMHAGMRFCRECHRLRCIAYNRRAREARLAARAAAAEPEPVRSA